MKQMIDLGKYKPSITSDTIAKSIYQSILDLDPHNNEIHIELGEIITMTTLCAKIIFGFLYLELGADLYYKNIHLDNYSEGLKIIIDFGLDHAIAQGKVEI